MTLDEFRRTLSATEPPPALTHALAGLSCHCSENCSECPYLQTGVLRRGLWPTKRVTRFWVEGSASLCGAHSAAEYNPFSGFPGYKIRRWPPADWPTGQATDSLAGVAYTENRRNFRSSIVPKLSRSHKDSNKGGSAKLPGKGIGPKHFHARQKKGRLPDSVNCVSGS